MTTAKPSQLYKYSTAARQANPLIEEQNNLTMVNVAAVRSYLACTFQIQHEASLCPDFNLPSYSAEDLRGLSLICHVLESALVHDAPPTVLMENISMKD